MSTGAYIKHNGEAGIVFPGWKPHDAPRQSRGESQRQQSHRQTCPVEAVKDAYKIRIKNLICICMCSCMAGSTFCPSVRNGGTAQSLCWCVATSLFRLAIQVLPRYGRTDGRVFAVICLFGDFSCWEVVLESLWWSMGDLACATCLAHQRPSNRRWLLSWCILQL